MPILFFLLACLLASSFGYKNSNVKVKSALYSQRYIKKKFFFPPVDTIDDVLQYTYMCGECWTSMK